ncbi:iron compound ABC superfamily ATP binding cassette transporter, ABC protein [Sporosarcina newyorkensis 2681]|uniref:Iron compound ABC superfamily ATP binding cassette transporter, ABC protein n=1 Tax=Sporosarcina newyorkensis 2681 TaxID=1027292 RepID=F9DU36_9BACL|nr:ABC transporter ATP-binding protein [Sporosarcina newyorkensis]EGQ25220.1 iron compound ABC superfamily ATP binding cassette transporter, ABC protein [Sporosarcina newyorkensis 2681]
MGITVEGISASIQEKKIISDIHLRVKPGQFVGLIGPNGSGKSTLLKSIYRINKPDCGKITLDSENLYEISAKKTAQKMAVVSQESQHTFEFSVMEIVLMGRAPHKKMMETDTVEDMRIAEEALEKVGLESYGDRLISTLSGGEKQRVMVARALAQQAKYLVLDEPTNHLDIHHQLQLMNLVKKLNITVIAALHDLNIASVYCDHIYVLNQGQLAVAGQPEEVLTETILQEIFRVNTHIIQHPITGKTHITFLSDAAPAIKRHEEVYI